jgi:hypothetical protein
MALVVNANEKTTAAIVLMSTFFALKFFVVITLIFLMFILIVYFIVCFFSTMQSYDDFLLIPRNFPITSLTCMDKRPTFGQIGKISLIPVQ